MNFNFFFPGSLTNNKKIKSNYSEEKIVAALDKSFMHFFVKHRLVVCCAEVKKQ